MKNVIACLVALGISMGLVGQAQAGDILFVSDVDSDNNIPTVLGADGHDVTVVTNDYAAGANPTLTGSLAAYDAVVWSATGGGVGGTHNAATFTALNAWVVSGGSVFVTGYDSVASPTDTNLITFLGAGGSRDVPAAAGAATSAANALTTGLVDIRGVAPTGGNSDRDALNALTAGTVGVVASTGSTTEFQWTYRQPTATSGVIAYVSNGASGTPSAHASWANASAGGAGAYNAGLRNFAFNASRADILFVSDVDSDNNIPAALRASGHDVTVVTNDYATGANPTLTGSLAAYDAVYWSATGTGVGAAHDAATFTALSAYVSAGGRVMVVGYDTVASPTDANLRNFLGAAVSSDYPGAIGACTTAANEVTVGEVDIRGVTPTGGHTDTDELSALGAGTVGVCGSASASTEYQVTLRTLGAGLAAYVSNGTSGTTSAHASWTNTAAGGAGAYNAMLRNFARWAAVAGTGASTLPPGAVCSAGADCGSGFCVDGVCCDSACGGGVANDCQACAVAAGAAADGTCGALDGATAPTITCRPSAAPCDAPETCVAGASACPADSLAGAGTVCRGAAGVCDAPETCTGASSACPADGYAAAGTVCRGAAGACDVAEVCTGAGTACPADAFATAGTECRAVAGVCDVAEACGGGGAGCPADTFIAAGTECRAAVTVCDLIEACSGAAAACPADLLVPDGMTCDDGLACTGSNMCTSGICAGPAVDCDDGDACTADACLEPGGCEHTAVAGCCTMDSDCDDGDPCTTDSCGGTDACAHAPIAGCGADAGSIPDSSVGDGGADGAVDDGGLEDGAVGDGGAPDSSVGRRPRGESGCACRVGAAPEGMPSEGALLFAGLAFVLAWRRRRRR